MASTSGKKLKFIKENCILQEKWTEFYLFLSVNQKPIENEASMNVSYYVEKISLKSKPFTDGEFFKECMESAAEVLCPSQK